MIRNRRALDPARASEAVQESEKHIAIADLNRIVPHFEEASPTMEKLGKEAKRVLGYKGLLLHTAGGELAATLESLEIEIIDPNDVYEYQSQLGKATLSQPVRFFEAAEYRKSRGGESDYDESDSEVEENDPEPTGAVRIAGTDWVRTPIRQYARAVPEFVISKAIQLKRALPTVRLYVEEFLKDPDPFLVAILHSEHHVEEYYIEVWEEPKFEGRFLKKL